MTVSYKKITQPQQGASSDGVMDRQPEEDPNKQGLIRTVPDAHLVYKRKSDNGTYDELWIYNTGNPKHPEGSIRKEILAGTDIPTYSNSSSEGKQQYTVWTKGNAQMLLITGLPN